MRTGDPDKAISCFLSGLNLGKTLKFPTYKSIITINYAIAKLQSNRFKEAIDLALKAIEELPKELDTLATVSYFLYSIL